MLKTGTIYGINGPVIYLKGNTGFRMSEMVYVGEQKLVGEVIALDKDLTTIQVYEETTGLRPGEEVVASGNAVSVTLAPGILNNIFDGIERPLDRIAESSGGAFITRGVSVDSLDRQKKWKKLRRERRMELEYMGVAPKVRQSVIVRKPTAGRKRSIWRRLLDWLHRRRTWD